MTPLFRSLLLPLAVGPDALALPLSDRFRYGVVLGSVMTSKGKRGCTGDAWLQPVRRTVEVRVGHVVRAVVTMRPQPLRSLP